MLSKLGDRIIQREKSYYSGWEWKIIGTPFSGTFGTGSQQRSMISVLCQIIKSMNSCGWKLGKNDKLNQYDINIIIFFGISVCSADISAKYHTTKHERFPIGTKTSH